MQNSALKRKLDAVIQKHYIKKYPISILGGKTEVMHHFIFKSQSEYLRYKEKNLIPLTNSQHFTLHNKDGSLSAEIAFIKGKKWFDWIKKSRRILVKQNATYFKKLKKMLNELSTPKL